MKRILIVEDDVSIGEVERDYLEVAGFEVTVMEDGLKGMQEAVNQDYDLVILDIMLPGMDGFKVCKEIMQHKDIPIILVTAKDEEIDKLRGFSMGIVDYVTKPFSPNELVARVKAHINRYEMLKVSGVQEKKMIEIRGLMIDTEARQVFVNGQEVELTVKQYDLLLLLASTPNKVFTKDEIFNKVWGFDSENDIPTITVHIRKIREKIEFDPSNPEYIHTVWGVGYKLKD